MHIHPDLRALRQDDSPQRQAQAEARRCLAAWQASAPMAEILPELDHFGRGGGLAGYPALSALFSAGSAAGDLARGFADATARLLRDQPLAMPGQRHFHDDVQSTLLLARAGNATLTLVAIDPQGFAARRRPATVAFWPGEAWEHVLAGQARVRAVDLLDSDGDRARLGFEDLDLRPGSITGRDAARRAMLAQGISGTLVSLCLQRRQPQAGPTREYDLASGRLAHQAAGNPRDSRIELMMAMLGRMGRRDAAPLLAELAREDGSEALRWQALRECLALDARRGFAALDAVARDAGDPLAASAGALRAQLIETYPQLGDPASCRR